MTTSQYATRAEIRRQIATRINKSSYYRVISVLAGENSNTKLLTLVGRGPSGIESGSSVQFNGQIGIVTKTDDENATVSVYFDTAPGSAPGPLEVWDTPFEIENINGLIDTVVNEAITLGHRIKETYTDWWLPIEGLQTSREVNIPAHIDTVSKVRSNREYNTTRQLRIEEFVANVQDGVTVAPHSVGQDWTVFTNNLPGNGLIGNIEVDATDDLRDVVLLGLSANRDVVVRVSDGTTDRRISLNEGSYRILPFKRVGGVKPFTVSLYSGYDDRQSFALRVIDRVSLLGAFTLKGKLRLDDWSVIRSNRSLSVNIYTPSELMIEAWRLPRTIEADTDLVEVPSSYVVDQCSALLLTSELQQAALDTDGTNQKASVILNERLTSERELDRVAYGRYVGYSARNAIDEDVLLGLDVTVGFIEAPGDPHPATQEFVFATTPFEFRVELPEDRMYLSIEWAGESAVTEIFIDGYDQTEAFTITGNRAVSDRVVVKQDDDSSVYVEIR